MTLAVLLLRRSVPSPYKIQGHYSSAISTKMESQGKFWRTTLSTISKRAFGLLFAEKEPEQQERGWREKTTQNWLQVGLRKQRHTRRLQFLWKWPPSINHLLFEQTLHLHEAPITIRHVRKSIFRRSLKRFTFTHWHFAERIAVVEKVDQSTSSGLILAARD